MGRTLIRAVALALAVLPSAASAQQRLPDEPPANPAQVVPDQRLKIADQRLLRAAETLKRAADDGDQARVEEAVAYGLQTVAEVRDIFDEVPPDRRASYDEAIARAEQALRTGDPATGSQAVSELQRTIRELAQRGT
jgi:hypothetical protein